MLFVKEEPRSLPGNVTRLGTARQISITAKTQIALGPPRRGMPNYGLAPALSDHFPHIEWKINNQASGILGPTKYGTNYPYNC
jgi:hypothetical protein